MMAFLTIEDSSGTVEAVAFPRTFEMAKDILTEDRKIFVKGRIQKNDEGEAKLIAEKIIAFENLPKEIWIQFADKEEYRKREEELKKILRENGGKTEVIIFLKKEKAMKQLPATLAIGEGEAIKEVLMETFGKENVKEKVKSLKFL